MPLLATVFTANVAFADPVVEVNGILADASGCALYSFDKDPESRSNCSCGGAAKWSPDTVPDS